jgi:hypothetical protein
MSDSHIPLSTDDLAKTIAIWLTVRDVARRETAHDQFWRGVDRG